MAEHFQRVRAALVDRYEIKRELGTGGMATVFLARDIRHDRDVAVKVLRPELAATLGSDRFLREIRIAAKLTHPNILPVHDSGDADGFLFYVMPFIEGESLRDRLRRDGQLSQSAAIEILREVVDALGYAHKQGVVHRDVKPDNVMLADGHAFVADFGVAKAVTDAAGGRELTTMGMAVGTPAYMSPEQAAGDPNVDHRADLYSVGAMAYEMLAGRPPFDDGSPQTVLAAHVTEVPESLVAHCAELPSGLANAVMQCLAKKPGDRWQDAGELRAALSAFATPSGAMTPVDWTPSATPGRIEVNIWIVVVVAAAVLLGGSYGLMVAMGLPGWVFPVAAAIVAVGVPLAAITHRVEQHRTLHTMVTAPGKPPPPVRWLSWRRMSFGLGAAFGLLGVVVAGYMAMRLLGIGPVGTLVASGVMDERSRVILADFANETSDSTLGSTVEALFRIDLTQSPHVSLLEPSEVASVLARMQLPPDTAIDDDLAREVAEREGLRGVVSGEILSLGGGYVLSARLVASSTGEVLWTDRETARDGDGLISAVDALSGSLRARIGESLRAIRADPPLARLTTRSTDALRLYVQGDRANDQDDSRRAIALIEAAIAQDSSFAMAHRKLGIILMNNNRDHDRAVQAFTTAYELRDRLSDRERWLAEAAYHTYVNEDKDAANLAYETLLARYPDDRIALNNLAVNYRADDRLAEALELHVRSIAHGNAPSVTFTNAIAASYELVGLDTAEAMRRLFRESYPEHPAYHRYGAALAAARFDYDAADSAMLAFQVDQPGDRAVEASTLADRGNYAIIQGRVQDARRLFREAIGMQDELDDKLTEQSPDELWASVDAVVATRYYDAPGVAIDTLEALLRKPSWNALPADERGYTNLASLFAEAGRPDRARVLLARYDVEVGEEERTTASDRMGRHAAEGAVALAEGRPEDAVTAFLAAREAMPGCLLCLLFELGRAYDAAGQPDSALAVYHRYLDTRILFRAGQDNVNLPFLLRRMGEVYDRQGNRERAVEYYARFLDLWERADPEMRPQMDVVRSRIATLADEPAAGVPGSS